MTEAWKGRFVCDVDPALLGDKISLPADVLQALHARLEGNLPLLFRVSSQHVPGGVCACAHFEARPRHAVLPPWLSQALQVPAGGLVVVSLLQEPLEAATHCVFEPMEPSFFGVPDARAMLESSLSAQFTTLTKDTIIDLSHGDQRYRLHVADLSPADAVHLIDTDMEAEIRLPMDDQGHPLFTPAPVAMPPVQGTERALAAGARGEAMDTQYTFHVLLVEAQVPIRIFITATPGGDLECYAGNELVTAPVREHHLFTNTSGEYLGIALIDVPATENHGKLYLGVRAYGCTTVSYVVAVDTYFETERLIRPAVAEGFSSCPNCREQMPTERLSLHTLHCARNLVFCTLCNKAVRRANIATHWHCQECVEQPFSTSSPEAKEKHVALFHTPLACPRECGQHLTLLAVSAHSVRECLARLVVCRFCRNQMPAGPPARDMADRMRNFTAHEAACGGRTDRCPKCTVFVRLRDFPVHMKLHATADVAGPTRALPKTPQAVDVPKEPRPKNPCRSICCAGTVSQPNALDLCLSCWAQTTGSSDTSPSGTELFTLLVRYYFALALNGCGREQCANPHCRMAVPCPPSQNEAAAQAMSLAQESLRDKAYICWVGQDQRTRVAADQLAFMGFPLDWCLLALDITGSDKDASVVWLLNHCSVAHE